MSRDLHGRHHAVQQPDDPGCLHGAADRHQQSLDAGGAGQGGSGRTGQSVAEQFTNSSSGGLRRGVVVGGHPGGVRRRRREQRARVGPQTDGHQRQKQQQQQHQDERELGDRGPAVGIAGQPTTWAVIPPAEVRSAQRALDTDSKAFWTAVTTCWRKTASSAITTMAVITVIITQPGTSPRSRSSEDPASEFVPAFTLATMERVTVVSHVAAVWLIFVMWVSWGDWPRVRVGRERGRWIE